MDRCAEETASNDAAVEQAQEVAWVNRQIVQLLLRLLRAGVSVSEVGVFFFPLRGISGFEGKPARLEGLRFLAQQKGLLD